MMEGEEASAALAMAEETREACLSFIGLPAVPAGVFKLTSLLRLDLGHNHISMLPAAIGALTMLEELWLNNNPIRLLPPQISDCSSLRVILLSETEITKLPCELARVPGLFEVNLDATPLLKPALAAAYERGGTLGVLEHLRQRDERKLLRGALAETLQYEVYREEGASPEGRAVIAGVAKAVMAALGDEEGSVRMVTRNAARLFPPTLAGFSPGDVLSRLTALQQDNMRKQLGADLELRLRALYYDRIDPAAVEGIVTDVCGALPSLEDTLFLLRHAKELLPREAAGIRGDRVLADLRALQARLAAELAAARAALTAALLTLYPDHEESEVAPLVADIVARLESHTASVRALAADAAECFPAELAAVRPRAVLKAFAASQQEKGLS